MGIAQRCTYCVRPQAGLRELQLQQLQDIIVEMGCLACRLVHYVLC